VPLEDYRADGKMQCMLVLQMDSFDQIKSHRFARGCPVSYSTYAYSARGRHAVALSLLNGKIIHRGT
jgi:hypothetical protein